MRKRPVFLILVIGLFQNVEAQKGDKSISAGPLISFPLRGNVIPDVKTGIGIEATGQYNTSTKSALLLQAGLTSFPVQETMNRYNTRFTLLSLKGGYKYDMGSSGVFINGLVGTDIEAGFSTISFTIGGGKRFYVKGGHFIDAGIDYIDGDTERRLNIKVAFSLLQRSKNNN